MRAGQLRNRVHIQEQTRERESSGAVDPDEGWRTVARRWASIEALSGSESVDAGQIQSVTTHRIKVRYFADLRVQHRIKYGARVFSLNSVLDMDGRKREQEVTATEVPAEDAP